MQNHRDGVGFLAARAPDVQLALAKAAGLERGKDFAPQKLERIEVAEKIALLGQQRIENDRSQAVGASLPHSFDQILDRRHLVLPGQGQQPRFDQILVLFRKVDAGPRPDQLLQVLERGVADRHIKGARRTGSSGPVSNPMDCRKRLLFHGSKPCAWSISAGVRTQFGDSQSPTEICCSNCAAA